MIAIVPQMRVFVVVEPVDFRNGIDGLVAVCRQRLQTDPMTGALFLFTSRRRRSLKVLAYDGQGFVLCQKRLSSGRFEWWPRPGSPSTVRLNAPELQLLWWNGDPSQATTVSFWRAISE